LDNLLQRALILVNGPVIRQEHIQFELANESVASEAAVLSVADLSNAGASCAARAAQPANSLASSLGKTERDLILDALRNGHGNRREAAERLGISQRTLRYKLARLREAGIDVPAA
jgi:two-component system, response regulator FlrC